MKTKAILSLFFPLILLSQSVLPQARIQGTIISPSEDSIEVRIITERISYHTLYYKQKLNKQNTFSFNIPLDDAVFAELYYAGQELDFYLRPNTDISIQFASGKLHSSIHYQGEGANENNFIKERIDRFVLNKDREFYCGEETMKKSLADFQKFIFHREQVQLFYLGEHHLSDSLSEEFFHLAQHQIRYESALHTWEYLKRKIRANNQMRPADISDDFLQFALHLPINEDIYLKVPEYDAFVTEVYVQEASLQKYGRMPSPEQELNLILEHFQGETRDFVLAKFLSNLIHEDSLQEHRDLYDLAMSQIRNPKYIKAVKSAQKG